MDKFTTNQNIHNFVVEDKHYIHELQATCYLIRHKIIGAKLLYIDNDEKNKAFSISFCTPAKDNSGVFHILEHSVFCGSKKYPVAEPFVELMKGSLNTFLNAMTFPDKTIYPVSSQNEKDLENLMSVYMDAVLHPNFYKNEDIFKQEGWHYEFDENGQPQYQGVVYNEMKGNLSDPAMLQANKIGESLFEDGCYTYVYGGNPNDIVKLTYEEFIVAHKKYYHPSNAYLFLYGKMDIESKLKLLDEEFLSHYSSQTVDNKISVQLKETSGGVYQSYYPVLEGEEIHNRDWVAFNYVIGEVPDYETMLGIVILSDILMGSNYAVLKKVIFDNELSEDAVFSLFNGIKYPYFSINLQECDSDKLESIRTIIFDALTSIVENGIDSDIIQASLSAVEFNLREKAFGDTPAGVNYAIIAMDTWLYGGKPWEALEYEEALKSIKAKMSKRYFENLINDYILKNDHTSVVIMKPSVLSEAQYSSPTLTSEEINTEMKNTDDYHERRQQPDSEEALRTIPSLKLSDLSRTSPDYHFEWKYVRGKKVMYHPVDSKGVVYNNLYFDINSVDKDTLFDLGLLDKLYGSIGTEKYHPEELNIKIKLYTGDICFEPMVYGVDNGVVVKLAVYVKALSEHWDKACKLTEEIILRSRLDDCEDIFHILSQEYLKMKMDLVNSGHGYAATRASACFSHKDACVDALSGIGFYEKLKVLIEDFDNQFEPMIARLNNFINKYLKNNKCHGSITCSKDILKTICKMPLICEEQIHNEDSIILYPELLPEKEGFLTSSDVQFVALSADFSRCNVPEYGVLYAFKRILSLNYLWKKVRVEGGAYGSGVRISRKYNMVLWSYRDPHIRKTLDAFKGAADYFKNLQLSEDELERIIIGCFSELDSPLSPQQIGQMSDYLYFAKISHGQLQAEREQLLNTNIADLQRCSAIMEQVAASNAYCIVGNAYTLQEKRKLFCSLQQI